MTPYPKIFFKIVLFPQPLPILLVIYWLNLLSSVESDWRVPRNFAPREIPTLEVESRAHTFLILHFQYKEKVKMGPNSILRIFDQQNIGILELGANLIWGTFRVTENWKWVRTRFLVFIQIP